MVENTNFGLSGNEIGQRKRNPSGRFRSYINIVPSSSVTGGTPGANRVPTSQIYCSVT